MIFDSETLTVLKNYSNINSHIVFREGNVINTNAPGKGLLARAVLPTKIDRTFGIAHLGRFLNALTLFTDPEITCHENYMTISDDSNTIRFAYADPDMLNISPKTELVLKGEYLRFHLKAEDYTEAVKAMNILGLSELAFVGEEGSLYLKAMESSRPSSDVFSKKIGETDKSFQLVYDSQNLKMLSLNYTVTIDGQGKFTQFSGENIDYWVASKLNASVMK